MTVRAKAAADSPAGDARKRCDVEVLAKLQSPAIDLLRLAGMQNGIIAYLSLTDKS